MQTQGWFLEIDSNKFIFSVRVMVACAPEQLDTLEPGLHLDKKFVCQAVEAVKHANWFEIEASGRFSN